MKLFFIELTREVFFSKKASKTTIRILQILMGFFKNSENSVRKEAEFSKQLNIKIFDEWNVWQFLNDNNNWVKFNLKKKLAK